VSPDARPAGRSPSSALAYALALIPPLAVLHLIHQHGVDVPVLDEWRWSVRHVLAGDLTRLDLGAFWKLDNEHRVFVPVLLGTALAHATGLNMLAPMYAKLALSGASLWILWRLFARLSGLRPPPVVLLPLSALVFSLAQWPRWIDVRPLPSTFSILGLAGALYLTSTGERSRRRFAGAAFCAWVSSSSYFSGNVTWLVVGLLLPLAGWARRSVVTWFVLAGAVWSSYAFDFLRSSTTTSAHPSGSPLELLSFVLVFLGSPCSAVARNAAEQGQALALGAAGVLAFGALALAVVRQVEDGWRKSAPWLALGLWTLINASAAAYGRAGPYGELGARAARYTVFGTQLWIALAMLAALALFEPLREPRGAVRKLGLAAALLAALGLAGGTLGMLVSGGLDAQAQSLRVARANLLLGEAASRAQLRLVHRQPDEILERLPALIERRASFLYGEHALRPADGRVAGRVQALRKGFSWRVREVLAAEPGARLEWDVELLERPFVYLSVGLALEPGSPARTVTAVLRAGGERRELLRTELSAHYPRLSFQQFDLSAWIGETVTIELEVEDLGGAPARRVLFVAPAVVYDVRRRERS